MFNDDNGDDVDDDDGNGDDVDDDDDRNIAVNMMTI